MLRSRPACRRLSEQDGSGRQGACHQRCLGSRQSRSPGDTSRWLNGRRSRSFTCRAIPCRRSLVGSAGRRRRSRGSCAATPPHEVAVWSIVRRRHSGTSSDPLVARSFRSSCATRRYTHLFGGTTGGRRRRSGRGSCSGPGRVLERTTAWATAGPAMGQGMEPGADRSPLADRLPGRWDDAYQPRSYLTGAVRPSSRGSSP